ncbi:MAG: hypothetical protein Q8Q25_02610 [bacterium]|nr:hypothetical protein [bacterium]
MARKFYFIFLSLISLVMPAFTMENQNRQNWVKMVRGDATICKILGEQVSKKALYSHLERLAAAIGTAAQHKIKFDDAEVNPIQLENGFFYGLHMAAQYGSVALIQAYLQHNIDPCKQGPDGKTPLEIARATENNQIITLLENAIKKPN